MRFYKKKILKTFDEGSKKKKKRFVTQYDLNYETFALVLSYSLSQSLIDYIE